jgi:hypothetical protein
MAQHAERTGIERDWINHGSACERTTDLRQSLEIGPNFLVNSSKYLPFMNPKDEECYGYSDPQTVGSSPSPWVALSRLFSSHAYFFAVR